MKKRRMENIILIWYPLLSVSGYHQSIQILSLISVIINDATAFANNVALNIPKTFTALPREADSYLSPSHGTEERKAFGKPPRSVFHIAERLYTTEGCSGACVGHPITLYNIYPRFVKRNRWKYCAWWDSQYVRVVFV